MEKLGKRSALKALLDVELIAWTGGLIYLALLNPYTQNHLSFCVFRLMGAESCPGCGLGRSISFLLHGDISASWQTHPLGIIALGILMYRIIVLLNRLFHSLFLKTAETTSN